MEESNISSDSRLRAIHFIFDYLVTDIRQISASFMERFDVQRIVYLKKSPKEKTLLKSAVVIFKSSKNWSEFKLPMVKIGGMAMEVCHITLEDAEDLIDQKRTKLYVGNIPFPVDNLALWNHFAQYGALDYSYILKPPVKRGPKGFGFVIFQKREAARAALSVKNYLEGVKLNCKLFMNKTKLKKRGTEAGESQHPHEHLTQPCAGQDFTDDDVSAQEHVEAELPLVEDYPYYQDANQFSPNNHQQKSQKVSKGCCHSETPNPIGQSPKKAKIQTAKKEPCSFQQLNTPANEILAKETQLFALHDKRGLYGEQSQGLYESQEALETGKTVTNNSDSTGSQDAHPCGCDADCKECWCDMIDSHYFSPPCCLCDFKPDPVKCHELLNFVRQSEKENHCLHPEIKPPHEPWEHDGQEDCVPCSRYQQLKKGLKAGRCKEYRLFKLDK